jgi:hypothetical protein
MSTLDIPPDMLDSICIMNLQDMSAPKLSDLDIKDSKAIKGSLKIEVSTLFQTNLIVIATNENSEKNNIRKIKCSGTPIGGYVYNCFEDCYYVRCIEHFDLGAIPIVFYLKGEGYFWRTFVPIPEIVIKRYISKMQELNLKDFKSMFKGEGFKFQFIQFIQ